MKDDEIKVKIAEVAKQEFLELGYVDASMRNISAKAGLTTGSLYNRFRDKAELFEYIVGDAVNGVKLKFGGNDSGSSNTPQAPQVNTAALLSSPINYTTEIKGAKAVEDAQDTRLYVLESDITSTVDKVRVVEEESTY